MDIENISLIQSDSIINVNSMDALAKLAERFNTTIFVPAEERFWGDDCFWLETWTESSQPGAIHGAATALHGHVSQLRKLLEPERAPGIPPAVIVTREPGYLLRLEPGELDLDRCERQIRDAREALAAGRADEASELLRALELLASADELEAELPGLQRAIGVARFNARQHAAAIAPLERALADAVGAAHAVGVLHKDLKPANIMIDGRGRVVDASLHDGVMISRARMTYTEVHAILEGDEALRRQYHELRRELAGEAAVDQGRQQRVEPRDDRLD